MQNVTRLFDVPQFQLKNYPQKDMFNTKVNGVWESISTQKFIELANKMSRALISMGVEPNDKIALVSSNRYEWNIMDVAIQQTRAIVVPVYPNIADKDYVYIFNDAEIKFAFVSGAELSQKILELKPQIEKLQAIYTFDVEKENTHWEKLLEFSDKVSMDEVENLKNQVEPHALATIIYTSGTTGNPKGVMLSHNNIISNVIGCVERIPADKNSKVLSFLPVCHSYERTLHYLYMYLGCSIYFAESMETIGENIKEVEPQIFTAVPRLIEKVYDKIMAKGEELTGLKRKLFFWALSVADEYEVEGKGLWYGFKLYIARKLIFSKWREALGGDVRAIASGSAALQPRLAKIFMAAGIPILEGYGLTETSPVISVNCLKKGIKIGTVGPVLQDVMVKINDDGEILVKGPNVMMGYYNLPDQTSEVMDLDGWFHTGDIGQMVDNKYLKITDRKKEIFKTSGGKYIAPQAMENKFKESRFIEQIMVIGENEKFPAALVVPNYPYIREWIKESNMQLSATTNEALSKEAVVSKKVNDEIERINATFGHWETIKKIHILPNEFSIATGELTPTLKFKRKIIMQKFSAEVNEIYKE